MTPDAPFEASGYWWLDSGSDRRVPGTLHVDAEGRCELRTIGSMRRSLEYGERQTHDGTTTTIRFTVDSLAVANAYGRIHGITERGAFTLLGCDSTSRNLTDDAVSRERIHVQVAVGCSLDPEEQAHFDGLTVGLHGLATWMGASIEETMTSADDQITGLGLTVHHRPPIAIGTLDGAAASLVPWSGMTGDGIEIRSLTRGYTVGIRHEGVVPIEDLLDEIGDLQDLVSIGTDRTAFFADVRLEHPDLVAHRGTRQPIGLFAQWNPAADVKAPVVKPHQLVFGFNDLGVDGVIRWRAVAKQHRSTLSRVMHARYVETDIGDRLLACVASLEAYDRDLGGAGTLHTRLRRAAAKAGPPFEAVVVDVDAWCRSVVRARNDIAHHNSRIHTAWLEYLPLGNAAHWLFVLCLLRDADAPPLVFDRIAAHLAAD